VTFTTFDDWEPTKMVIGTTLGTTMSSCKSGAVQTTSVWFAHVTLSPNVPPTVTFVVDESPASTPNGTKLVPTKKKNKKTKDYEKGMRVWLTQIQEGKRAYQIWK
jgi:hypothetical protein